MQLCCHFVPVCNLYFTPARLQLDNVNNSGPQCSGSAKGAKAQCGKPAGARGSGASPQARKLPQDCQMSSRVVQTEVAPGLINPATKEQDMHTRAALFVWTPRWLAVQQECIRQGLKQQKGGLRLLAQNAAKHSRHTTTDT